ncbi:hypothetical protein C1646_754834 [Rhizophagus diaphanus]|nr:hypothetical protein C1646_754834 [Rhizophagus diaphanus] [Rhizophagus sp. MUCL 43196]
MINIIPILLSQISLQERIDLELKDIPTKIMFDYVSFIQQFDISLLYRLVCEKKYTMPISKTIFMKTKKLDELTFSYEYNLCESIFTLPKSQILLNHITKLKFDTYGKYSPFPNLSIYVKNIKYLSIDFSCEGNHKNAVKFFEDLIEFISVQNNLEYFIINIKYNLSGSIIHMEKWRELFFKLSESHSIKYIMIKGCFDGEQTDLNFLSNCSNLEELHLDSMIIDYDKLLCLKNIYLHNTLKELKIILRIESVKQNNLKSILDDLSLYCQNLTLIGLKLEHIFGYINKEKVDEILNEFKSLSLPKTLKSLSFEGVIELNHLEEIMKNYIDNLINLDFYYYTCVNVLERDIDEMTKNKKLKLRYDKEKISFGGKFIYRYFLDFNYPWLASHEMDGKVLNLE